MLFVAKADAGLTGWGRTGAGEVTRMGLSLFSFFGPVGFGPVGGFGDWGMEGCRGAPPTSSILAQLRAVGRLGIASLREG